MNARLSRPVVRALIVWIALMVLLALTVSTSFFYLGAANFLINIIIAIAKAALVALFYMQLSRPAVMLRIVALAGLLCISVLFLLSGVDYLTRTTQPAPWQHTPPSLSDRPS